MKYIAKLLTEMLPICYNILNILLQEVNIMETKREKFVRLAEARTNKIIDMLQLLGNCSNSSAYDYTQQDVEKIFSAIEQEMREAKKKFSKIESKKSTRFTLE